MNITINKKTITYKEKGAFRGHKLEGEATVDQLFQIGKLTGLRAVGDSGKKKPNPELPKLSKSQAAGILDVLMKEAKENRATNSQNRDMATLQRILMRQSFGKLMIPRT